MRFLTFAWVGAFEAESMFTIGIFEPLLLVESSRVLVFPVMSANLGSYTPCYVNDLEIDRLAPCMYVAWECGKIFYALKRGTFYFEMTGKSV